MASARTKPGTEAGAIPAKVPVKGRQAGEGREGAVAVSLGRGPRRRVRVE
jgi:hypothetical protein